ncbi:hypothetical protein ANN_17835 [Periplaneta americana]|uniref:Reverse transcriptase domain-containing protein n=1 Tax=Periplaneta americana TaxID=6978 RepID=A0ABQ8SVD4_PERAM|nr:hypothetical protein ANN_17835 [Periplaneta americana]
MNRPSTSTSVNIPLSNRFNKLLNDETLPVNDVNQQQQEQQHHHQQQQEQQQHQQQEQQQQQYQHKNQYQKQHPKSLLNPQAQASSSSRPIKPPPVVVKKVNNHLSFIKSCINITNDPSLICTFTIDGLKLHPKTVEAHNKLTKHLISENIEFHTFISPTERPLKYVIKRLPPTISEEEIYEELLALKHPVQSVRQFTTEATGFKQASKLPVWLVTLENSPAGEAIRQCTGLFNIKMSVEPYQPKPSIRQCYKCQAFGHVSTGCHHQSKCVKCAGEHSIADCPKKGPEHEALYANCGDKLTASYRQCPKFMSYVNLTTPKPIVQNELRIQPPSPSDSTATWAKIASINSQSAYRQSTQPLQSELHELHNLLRSFNIQHFLLELKDVFEQVSMLVSSIREVMATIQPFNKPTQHDSIPHRQVNLQYNPDLEATGVIVKTIAAEILFSAIYAHPGAPFPLQHLRYLTNYSQYFVLAGDYNAKHQQWNSFNTCYRGRQLARFVQENGFTILAPKEPTHYPYNPRHAADIIDFALLECPLPPLVTYTLPELQSDHSPVLLELSATYSQANSRPHYPLITTNWNAYKDELDTIMINFPKHADVEDAQVALNVYTSTLQDKLDKEIQEASNPPALWKTTNKFTKQKQPPLMAIQGSNGVVYTPCEKAAEITNSLETRFRPNVYPEDPNFTRDVELRVHRYLQKPPTAVIEDITPHEVTSLIKGLPSRKSPGFDTSFQRKQHTVALFLGVKEAFDRVWHNGLLCKVIQFNFPDTLVYCIADYLTSRSFQVYLEHEFSPITPIKAGAPQGSVLGPILYLLYTADFPLHRSCQTAFFADDTLVYYCAKSLPFIIRILQGYVRQFEDWITKWRININTAKTQAVIFSKRRVQLPQSISVFGNYINYELSIKYLGIHLDRRLTAARMITNSPRGLRIAQLHEDLGLEAIQSIIIRRITHLYGRYLQEHPNPLLNALGNYNIIGPHRRPKALLAN